MELDLNQWWPGRIVLAAVLALFFYRLWRYYRR
jgi:hypothetical protein